MPMAVQVLAYRQLANLGTKFSEISIKRRKILDNFFFDYFACKLVVIFLGLNVL